jgi:hypothetical protein
MSKTLQQALENVYTSLHNDNEDIDLHIANLKSALHESGKKEINVDPNRLPQNNRQGRKMLQSYFKKRGVAVNFSE